jgi:hypothetical protein
MLVALACATVRPDDRDDELYGLSVGSLAFHATWPDASVECLASNGAPGDVLAALPVETTGDCGSLLGFAPTNEGTAYAARITPQSIRVWGAWHLAFDGTGPVLITTIAEPAR